MKPQVINSNKILKLFFQIKCSFWSCEICKWSIFHLFPLSFRELKSTFPTGRKNFHRIKKKQHFFYLHFLWGKNVFHSLRKTTSNLFWNLNFWVFLFWFFTSWTGEVRMLIYKEICDIKFHYLFSQIKCMFLIIMIMFIIKNGKYRKGEKLKFKITHKPAMSTWFFFPFCFPHEFI